jgi:predicted  nucleic acid-binding Zn-ribbon protein
VEKINPDLVIRDEEGKPYSVRYDQVNAMLLNEFLKEHRKVRKLEATVADLKTAKAQEESVISDLRNEMHALAIQLKVQAEQIQKVSTQINVRNAGSDLALNRP